MEFHYITSKESYQYELRYPELHTAVCCHIVYSKRKSLSIQIQENGQVLVRAPHYAQKSDIERFIQSKRNWIYLTHRKVLAMLAKHPPLSPEEEAQAAILEKQLRKEARERFLLRAAHYQPFTGGSYTSITVRDQKSRWGSCSSKGTLSFNYRLILAPPEVLDYVVVHELCHLTYMNHSRDFWNMVGRILPDYKRSRQWLKEHGQELNISSLIRQKEAAPFVLS